MKIKTSKKEAAEKTVITKKADKAATCCCAARKPGRPKKTVTEVTFTVHAEKGKAVYVAGDFNGWDPTTKKMAFRNGVYSTKIKLEPGDHQYKFVIDGTWCADPENVNAIPNDQGTFNSVITVK